MKRSKNRKKGKSRSHSVLFGISAGTLMAVGAALLLLSYISVVANPEKVWVLSVFGLLFFPIALLNLGLLIWACVKRSRLLVIPLLALLPSISFIGRYVQLGGPKSIAAVEKEGESAGNASGAVKNAGGVKLLTYNVDRFAYKKKCSSRSERRDSIFAFLRRQDADIICLQEFYTRDPSRIRSYVKKHLPGYSVEYYVIKCGRGYSGNLTLSRFPARSKGKILFEESTNLAFYSDYRLPSGKRFRVYNCHFESYAISLSNLWKSLTGDKEQLQNTENKYRKSLSRRPRQVNTVLENIEECPVEAIVCGDFNDNPMSYTYLRISRGRKDTFVGGGSGFGASYAAFWPMLRIDYVFVPKAWTPLVHRTQRIKYSDHYPILTRFALSGE